MLYKYMGGVMAEVNIDFLIVFSQIAMAFVAFATIVATLRQAFGGKLTPLQNLLFRFYVEVGIILVLQSLIPIALLNIYSDKLIVWRVSNYLLLLAPALYLPFYLSRRLKISAPIPPLSIFVMAGYSICIVLAIITATEQWWLPSLATTAGFLIWGLASNFTIFVLFLGSFIELEENG